jgi:hypothetical protein
MLKAKTFETHVEAERVEQALNAWLSKVPITIVRDYQVGDDLLIFLYTEDFSRNAHRLDGEEPRCAQCNRPMKVRAALKTGDLFWGCTGYPDCKTTQPLTDLDWEKLAGPGTKAPQSRSRSLAPPCSPDGHGGGYGDDGDLPF